MNNNNNFAANSREQVHATCRELVAIFVCSHVGSIRCGGRGGSAAWALSFRLLKYPWVKCISTGQQVGASPPMGRTGQLAIITSLPVRLCSSCGALMSKKLETIFTFSDDSIWSTCRVSCSVSGEQQRVSSPSPEQSAVQDQVSPQQRTGFEYWIYSLRSMPFWTCQPAWRVAYTVQGSRNR